ncbi:MAG: hypothetical protein J6Y80_03715 [Victivallales bacterium]|nr:hypothetical protein [Victivallales bacterium]
MNRHRTIRERIALAGFLLFAALMTSTLLAAPQTKGEIQKEQELIENTKQVAEGKLAMKGPMHDEWLVAAWNYTKEHAIAAWDWLSTHVHNVLFEDFKIDEISPLALAILIVILATMFLSGCWAASIAQSRRHPRLPAFFLGFFTFFAGPAYLLYNMDIKGEKELLEKLAQEAAVKRAEEEERERRKQDALTEKGKLETPAVSQYGVTWDEKYFNSIQRKADGTPDGPWMVTYNGVQVKVLEIIEVLPTLVAVRLINQEGHELRGRIPYARITQWDRTLPT